MSADGTPDRAAAKGALPLPVLLADRHEVAFVATPRAIESLRIPRRYWGAQVGVVAVPVSDEEVRGAELLPSSEAGAWPRVATRPDLLAPALSRLLAGDHAELSLQPGRDGLRVTLVTAANEEQPFPVAPKDGLGFLSEVFQHAPRGVVKTAGGRSRRVLLSVRPAARPHEYRVRIAGVLDGAPPATLADIGLSPAVLEMVLDNLDRRAGIFLIAGGPGSGRSTTLDLLATTLAGRGARGARIGPRSGGARAEIPWLAGTLGDWPFPESLAAGGPDFILVEHLDGVSDLLLAARLASSGCLVVAGAPAADAAALAKTVRQELATGAAPDVPVAVLTQTLARTPCRSCMRWTSLSAEQTRRLGFHRRDVEEFERKGGLAVARGEGCAECSRTGCAGLTGIHEFIDPEGGAQSLPRLREEGWRKVVQGLAVQEDVMVLQGGQRPMRTLREILVHAGVAPLESHAAAPRDGATAVPSPAAPEGPQPPAITQPAQAEAQILAEVFKDGRKGRPSDGKRLSALAKVLCSRAAGGAPLAGFLAATAGYQLAAHSVNTALIATRLWTALGNEPDSRLALLALLHDAGLLQAGVDPEATLPPAPLPETLDPQGARLNPAATLRGLGPEAATQSEGLIAVQSLLRFELPTTEERAGADLRAQTVALSCLIEMHRHGVDTSETRDLHDVTSLVMEQHGRRFSPNLFRALLKAIPIFPIGCLVELSSGDLARVVSLNQDNPFRPRVEITASSSGEDLGERRIIDLARAPFLHVRNRVSGHPIPERVAV